MSVPAWSGNFTEVSKDIYMMCLHIGDERMIPAPPGLVMAADLGTLGTDANVYLYVREESLERTA